MRGAVQARRAGLDRRQRVERPRSRGRGGRASRCRRRRRTRRPRSPTNRTTAAAPAGVACPTVSATQTRDAPARIAVEYKRAQRLRIGARRVLGDVHDRQAFADGEGDGLLGELQQLVERPALRRTAAAGWSR